MLNPFARYLKTALLLISLATSVCAFGQIEVSEEDRILVLASSKTFRDAALNIAEIIDPANHQCCVTAPPATVVVYLADGTISLVTEVEDGHWLDIEAELEEDLSFATETSSTIAGFDDVRSTFSGQIFQDTVIVEATLGVDGELFDQDIVYTLEVDLGEGAFNNLAPPITQAPVEKVKAVGGSASDASFQSGASSDGGATTGTAFTTSDNVIIAGTVNVDPSDQGMAGEVYVVLLAITGEGAALSFLNEDGNYESWDQSIAGLGAHISTNSLNASYNITVSAGMMAAGSYRVALAYSRGGKLIYAPKAIVVTVN